MKYNIIFAAVIAVVPTFLLAAPVSSPSNVSGSANGIYVGTEFGYNVLSDTNKYFRDEVTSIYDSLPNHYALSPYIGYKFNEHYAVELGYSNPNNIDDARHCSGSTCNSWHYKVYGATMSFLLSEPLVDNNNVYAKAGLGIMHADVRDSYAYEPTKLVVVKQNKVVGIIGAGAQHNFGKHFNVGVAVIYQSHNDYVPANTLTALRVGYVF